MWRLMTRATSALRRALHDNVTQERAALLQGTVAAVQLGALSKIRTLAEVEFSVFSQWGEDGIIEWVIERLGGQLPESFVEFGVENYRESNTRFLLQNRNWRGLVIDGSKSNIDFIKNDQISWRHDLTAISAFITAENINSLLTGVGFGGEIGILSIDIDGNDYWVWKAIEASHPHIVIVEYNSVLGDLLPLTIPYDPAFVRTRAHASNLYYGASINLLCDLARAKGYVLVGTNLAGNNAFFVRNDRMAQITPIIEDRSPRPSRFRESRNDRGQLTLVRGLNRAREISECSVVDVSSGRTGRLGDFEPLYSSRWLAMMEGRIHVE